MQINSVEDVKVTASCVAPGVLHTYALVTCAAVYAAPGEVGGPEI